MKNKKSIGPFSIIVSVAILSSCLNKKPQLSDVNASSAGSELPKCEELIEKTCFVGHRTISVLGKTFHQKRAAFDNATHFIAVSSVQNDVKIHLPISFPLVGLSEDEARKIAENVSGVTISGAVCTSTPASQQEIQNKVAGTCILKDLSETSFLRVQIIQNPQIYAGRLLNQENAVCEISPNGCS